MEYGASFFFISLMCAFTALPPCTSGKKTPKEQIARQM